MRYLILIACGVLSAACSSTYHPEYHPVTVTQVSQDLSYPVTVNSGPAASTTEQQRSPVVIVQPVAPAPIAAPARPPTPPQGWQNWPAVPSE